MLKTSKIRRGVRGRVIVAGSERSVFCCVLLSLSYLLLTEQKKGGVIGLWRVRIT